MTELTGDERWLVAFLNGKPISICPEDRKDIKSSELVIPGITGPRETCTLDIVEVRPVIEADTMAHTEDWRDGVRAAREVVKGWLCFPDLDEGKALLNLIDALLIEDKPDGKTDT